MVAVTTCFGKCTLSWQATREKHVAIGDVGLGTPLISRRAQPDGPRPWFKSRTKPPIPSATDAMPHKKVTAVCACHPPQYVGSVGGVPLPQVEPGVGDARHSTAPVHAYVQRLVRSPTLRHRAPCGHSASVPSGQV